MSLYIVQAGDTLQKISSRWAGTSAKWKLLATYNELKDPNKLYVGQTIMLPEAPEPTPKLKSSNGVVKKHKVCFGDNLWQIAARYTGDPNRWREILALNDLEDANQLYVGQILILPKDAFVVPFKVYNDKESKTSTRKNNQFKQVTRIPVRVRVFIIADEFNPLTKKVVRKIAYPLGLEDNPELVKRIITPEKYGITPRYPKATISIGEHVLENTQSNYISVSTLPKGSPNYSGTPYFIDKTKLLQSGAEIFDSIDIIKDLDRIASQTTDADFLKKIADLKYKSVIQDHEELVKGFIDPKFVKSANTLRVTRGLQFVQGVGIVMSAYDLGKAGYTSYDQGTPRPIIAETVRQAGGWGAGFAGAQIGGALGTAVGIETGPGALLFGAVGAAVFGTAGFFGADWVADFIYDDAG